MINSKKLIAILLTFVLCFSLCAVMTSAEGEFQPTVKLSASYIGPATDGANVTVTTSQACGAISGTLTYSDAKYVSATANEDGSDQFVQTEGQVKFVIVTDNLSGDNAGDFAWATFSFNGIGANAKFELKDVKVCDVNASDLQSPSAVAIEDVKPITIVGTLGSQYRKAEGNVTAGLRFGAKIVRAKGTNKLTGNDKVAISTGCLMGFADNIATKNGIAATAIDLKSFVNSDNKVNDDNTLNITAGKGVLAIKSRYYKEAADDYLVCTFVVEGLDNYADKDIVFLPYVVYENGDTKEVSYGTQIVRNYNEVVNTYNFVSTLAE